MVENISQIIIEAGELRVGKQDSVLPTKLEMLAKDGWAISDAWKLKSGGFNLLLTRKMDPVDTKQQFIDDYVPGINAK